jgi:hypothetical protein
VLLACTAGEALLLRQLQALQLGQKVGPTSTSSPTYSTPSWHSGPMGNRTGAAERVLPAAQSTVPFGAARSAHANGDQRSGPDVKRDYDYFAELDEKLARLSPLGQDLSRTA